MKYNHNLFKTTKFLRRLFSPESKIQRYCIYVHIDGDRIFQRNIKKKWKKNLLIIVH